MATCCHYSRRVRFKVAFLECDRCRLVSFVCVAAMKADRKRLKVEKADIVNQMQQLYTTLESREEQLREFIRNYDQHRKVQ